MATGGHDPRSHSAGPSPGRAHTIDGEAGGDLTWNFTGDLTGYLAVNPDFAETETDDRQVNLTRFPLFFPEKRAFFLEGSDIFEFGSGLGNDFIPFFSRRIGLFDGERVPLLGGAKLLGRTGRWRVAALAVAADQTELTQRTNLFSGRVTYDVDKNLTLGVIATDERFSFQSINDQLVVKLRWTFRW